MSFDVWESETPRLEIYGTKGTLCIPDPDPGDGANIFHGPVWLRTRNLALDHAATPQSASRVGGLGQYPWIKF